MLLSVVTRDRSVQFPAFLSSSHCPVFSWGVGYIPSWQRQDRKEKEKSKKLYPSLLSIQMRGEHKKMWKEKNLKETIVSSRIESPHKHPSNQLRLFKTGQISLITTSWAWLLVHRMKMCVLAVPKQWFFYSYVVGMYVRTYVVLRS